MGKLKHLFLHCTDTPARMLVTQDMIRQWHQGPCDLDGGRVKYLGKIYPSRKALPDDQLGGVPIIKLQGRGWDRLGYYKIIHQDGSSDILTPNDLDNIITSDEMTWGVAGMNSGAIHIVLEGGRGALGKFEHHFTPGQDTELFAFCKLIILRHPSIIILGHNQKANKSCPGFFVYDWLMDHSIESWGCRKLIC